VRGERKERKREKGRIRKAGRPGKQEGKKTRKTGSGRGSGERRGRGSGEHKNGHGHGHGNGNGFENE
jgi:hypothetical protein